MKLSIVVPVYNGAPYLENCYRNLTKSTFQDWELIFVNDGSKDNSKEVLDSLGIKDKRIVVIHKENGGTSTARNAGLDQAKGTYIYFMDCDDEVDKTMLEKMVYMMDDTSADVGICGFYTRVDQIDKHGKKCTAYQQGTSYPTSIYKSKKEIKEHLVSMWDADVLQYVWNKLYRLDVIRNNDMHFREGHVYTEDTVFNRQFVKKSQSIAITEECLYYYYKERPGSMTDTYRKDYFKIRVGEYNEFKQHFRDMDEWNEESREFCSRQFIERVSGTIENLFHSTKGELSTPRRISYTRWLLNNDDVIEACKYARCRSKKMQVLVWPIKHKMTLMAYILHGMVYRIRTANPVLFYTLKKGR